MRVAKALLLMVACSWALPVPTAHAGGGPETTVVVVNADSPLSMTIGMNHAQERGIHPSHICRLRGMPSMGVITLAQWKERVRDPLFAFLDAQGLRETTDVIAFSVDFPYGVDFRPLVKDKGLHDVLGKFPIASFTGALYLAGPLEEGHEAFLDMDGKANPYIAARGGKVVAGRGYRARYAWRIDGTVDRSGEEGRRTGGMLATMLGYTGHRGNSANEVLRCLRRSREADFTSPKGTVYLMANPNVRAKTRRGQFESALALLKEAGGKGEVLEKGKGGEDGISPKKRKDVMGVVAGTAKLDWARSKSTLLPGSIAEHLTSFGAHFGTGSQTKCTEYIRHGASGTCGAVVEPYAIQAKFPLAHLHAHYRAGCSLAEAFHASVMNPYQLLVIGDPLARPYANKATVSLASPDATAPWKGTVALEVQVDSDGEHGAREIEAWVDGRFVVAGAPDAPLSLDTTVLSDGWHDLRLVAVEDSDVETRWSVVVPFEVGNRERSPIKITLPRKPPFFGEEEVLLKGSAKGAREVEVRSGTQVLGTMRLKGSSWRMKVSTRGLRVGENPLRVVAIDKDGDRWQSEMAILEVGVPRAEKPKRKPRGKGKRPSFPKGKGGAPGLAIRIEGGGDASHEGAITGFPVKGKGTFLAQFRKLRGKEANAPIQRVLLRGEIHAGSQGLYRLAAIARGTLEVRIAGQVVLPETTCAADHQVHGICNLDEGWAPIEIVYVPDGTPRLALEWGGATPTVPAAGKDVLRQ